MKNSYLIRAVCNDTGSYFYVPTSNPRRTIREIEDSIAAGNTTRVKWQEKINSFSGMPSSNLRFEIYRLVGVEDLNVGRMVQRIKRSLGFA